jgi:hypothetical protein
VTKEKDMEGEEDVEVGKHPRDDQDDDGKGEKKAKGGRRKKKIENVERVAAEDGAAEAGEAAAAAKLRESLVNNPLPRDLQKKPVFKCTPVGSICSVCEKYCPYSAESFFFFLSILIFFFLHSFTEKSKMEFVVSGSTGTTLEGMIKHAWTECHQLSMFEKFKKEMEKPVITMNIIPASQMKIALGQKIRFVYSIFRNHIPMRSHLPLQRLINNISNNPILAQIGHCSNDSTGEFLQLIADYLREKQDRLMFDAEFLGWIFDDAEDWKHGCMFGSYVKLLVNAYAETTTFYDIKRVDHRGASGENLFQLWIESLKDRKMTALVKKTVACSIDGAGNMLSEHVGLGVRVEDVSDGAIVGVCFLSSIFFFFHCLQSIVLHIRQIWLQRMLSRRRTFRNFLWWWC